MFKHADLSKLAASEARQSGTAKVASARVAQMLNLRGVVKNIPLLAKALAGCRSHLLQIVKDGRNPTALSDMVLMGRIDDI